MPTISQLTATNSLTDTDQIPVYSTNNGDARKASLSTFKAYLTTNLSLTGGTFTNSTFVNADLGTPAAGILTNCVGYLASNLVGVIPVVKGGTGVTVSSGANSVTLRDANANISANNFYTSYSNTAAAGTITTLTAASAYNFVVTGSGGQTFKLPDATTLPAGTVYRFNNNQSAGTIVVQNNSSTPVATLQSGSVAYITLLVNSPAAGSWDAHYELPSNVAWSTNTLSWTGSITNATWNGVAVGALYGGTGLTSPGPLNNVLTSNGAGGWTSSPLPSGAVTSFSGGTTGLTPNTPTGGAIVLSGTLAVTNGGTGQSTLAGARAAIGLGAAVVKTAAYTAVAGDVLACNTITTAAFTVTLPASPAAGDKPIVIFDAGTTDTVNGFATNNLTVARNGSTIHTLAEDVIFSTKGVCVTFEYINGTWRIRVG